MEAVFGKKLRTLMSARVQLRLWTLGLAAAFVAAVTAAGAIAAQSWSDGAGPARRIETSAAILDLHGLSDVHEQLALTAIDGRNPGTDMQVRYEFGFMSAIDEELMGLR